ncbi:unnamed protein product [Spirodela intermedia]|uniref:Reverse transcriptase Ty1/copia-type domain-containing protein n=1 Tax=Spirodela intermedia TaxID=51605 RepID=A0A7I8KS19_SPIIN|nr:unnamed protein product [Spirodela intermedia]
MTVLIVYVDDILITGDDTNEIQNLSKNLSQEFDIKSLGRLRYFLDTELAHSKQATPVDINVKLGARRDSPPINKESFQRLIGKLIYLNHTRPDVAYDVSSLSQFMNDPREIHLQATYRILVYLKNTIGQGLLFSQSDDSIVEIYTEVDYARSVSDKRSTSGYCSFVGGNLVSWRRSKR